MTDGTNAADTANETTTTIDSTTIATPDTGAESSDLTAEVEKWKALAQKHEGRAKQNATAARELETLRQSAMSDQEKAVSAAKAEGRTEALREAGTRLVDAEVRAAAAGRNVDTDALLEGLDRTKFLDDDGEPDRDAITAWIDRIAPAEQERGFAAPNLEQGTRSNGAGALALGSDPLTQTLKNKLGIR